MVKPTPACCDAVQFKPPFVDIYIVQFAPAPLGPSLCAITKLAVLLAFTIPLKNPPEPPVVKTFAHVVPPSVVLQTLALPEPVPPSPTKNVLASSMQPQYSSGPVIFPVMFEKFAPPFVV